MAITFIQKRKKQRYLILVFIGILLITTIVIWQGFLKEEISSPPEVFRPRKKVEINFKALESPVLEELQSFEEIKPFEEVIVEGEVIEKLGRENPFLPY